MANEQEPEDHPSINEEDWYLGLLETSLRSVVITQDSSGNEDITSYTSRDKVQLALLDYDVLEILGKGGSSVVYKVQNKISKEFFAAKYTPAYLIANKKGKALRIQKEFEITQKLSHRNTTITYQLIHGNDRSITLLMEYIPGRNLEDIIKSQKLPIHRSIELIIKLLDTLDYAHNLNIHHRDVKPSNIMIEDSGELKILDFGIAYYRTDFVGDEANNKRLTSEHEFVGTPTYAAPEQLEGNQSSDHRSDIFSAGAILYELLTNERPIGNFSLPSTYTIGNKSLDRVINKALENSVSKRYPSAKAMSLDLQNILSRDLSCRSKRKTLFKLTCFGVVLGTLLSGCLFGWKAPKNYYTQSLTLEHHHLDKFEELAIYSQEDVVEYLSESLHLESIQNKYRVWEITSEQALPLAQINSQWPEALKLKQYRFQLNDIRLPNTELANQHWLNIVHSSLLDTLKNTEQISLETSPPFGLSIYSADNYHFLSLEKKIKSTILLTIYNRQQQISNSLINQQQRLDTFQKATHHLIAELENYPLVLNFEIPKRFNKTPSPPIAITNFLNAWFIFSTKELNKAQKFYHDSLKSGEEGTKALREKLIKLDSNANQLINRILKNLQTTKGINQISPISDIKNTYSNEKVLITRAEYILTLLERDHHWLKNTLKKNNIVPIIKELDKLEKVWKKLLINQEKIYLTTKFINTLKIENRHYNQIGNALQNNLYQHIKKSYTPQAQFTQLPILIDRASSYYTQWLSAFSITVASSLLLGLYRVRNNLLTNPK